MIIFGTRIINHVLYLDQSRFSFIIFLFFSFCFSFPSIFSFIIFLFFSFCFSFPSIFFPHFVIFLQSFHSLIHFFYLILRSFWYTPWADFQGIDNPCLGWFWKILFLAQRGCKGYIYFYYFLDKETWPYIIPNHDCVIFKRLTLKQNSMTSNICQFFISHFFSSSLLLWPPLRVFSLTDHLLFLPLIGSRSTKQPTERK